MGVKKSEGCVCVCLCVKRFYKPKILLRSWVLSNNYFMGFVRLIQLKQTASKTFISIPLFPNPLTKHPKSILNLSDDEKPSKILSAKPETWSMSNSYISRN